MKKIIILIAVLAVLVSVATFSLPAAFAAELMDQTLSSGDVIVTGRFEEGAALTVTVSPYTASALEALVKRKQVSSEKNIVGVYNIEAGGEEAEEPSYQITIKNVKLNQLVKNKVSVIDEDGVYHAISDFDYVNGSVSFQSPALGEVVIYHDPTVLYLIVVSAVVILILIIALKLVAAQRYKDMKAGKHSKKKVREHDRRYW